MTRRPASVIVTSLALLAGAVSLSACGSNTGDFLLTCNTEGVKGVEGGASPGVSSTISGNLDTSQKDIGSCDTADAVVRRVAGAGAEMPVTVDGFRCTPSVLSTGPDVVKWSCNFKGADTDTDVTLRFEATYKG